MENQTISPNSLPRVAVIGGGHLGRIHAKLLACNTNCNLLGVADPSDASRTIVECDLALPSFTDYRVLEKQIDAAVIAAPTFLHHEIGKWCLERGIHTFIEKPIAASAEESHELVALAHENNCVLQVGHVERFNPAWVTASSLCAQESVRYIESAREGSYTGRSTDIGIVMDLMIHDIDLILSLVPSTLTDINAYGWSVLGEHEDFAVAQLRFKNGAVAQLRASRISELPKRTMQIHTEARICSIDFASGSLSMIQPQPDVASGMRQADTLPAAQRLKVKDRLFQEWLSKTEIKSANVNAIALEHQEFLEAIQHGKSVTVNGHAGTAALSVALEVVAAIHHHHGSGLDHTTVQPFAA